MAGSRSVTQRGGSRRRLMQIIWCLQDKSKTHNRNVTMLDGTTFDFFFTNLMPKIKSGESRDFQHHCFCISSQKYLHLTPHCDFHFKNSNSDTTVGQKQSTDMFHFRLSGTFVGWLCNDHVLICLWRENPQTPSYENAKL